MNNNGDIMVTPNVYKWYQLKVEKLNKEKIKGNVLCK